MPKWFPIPLASTIVKCTIGNFVGYNPADAAQDLLSADDTVLVKKDGSIVTVFNPTIVLFGNELDGAMTSLSNSNYIKLSEQLDGNDSKPCRK